MQTSEPLRFLPTLPMLAEYLSATGWNWEMSLSDQQQHYRGYAFTTGNRNCKRTYCICYALRKEIFPLTTIPICLLRIIPERQTI